MLLARTPHVLLPLACALLALLTSCSAPPKPEASSPPSQAPALGSKPAAPESARPAPPDQPRAADRAPLPPPPLPARPRIDPVAAPVVERLSAQLLIPPEAIVVIAVEPAEWPDACLGLAAEDEICASVITPGYRVVLGVGADAYEFRTDATGERIRLASAPPARTGDPLVTWRDTRSFNMMIIGTQRVALGRRGRPLIASPLAVPARAAELQDFLAHYAPFEARTPVGDVALRGVGSARPGETEQRLIAEWARLVSIEARLGAEDPEANVALRWTLQGGRGDVCDRIEVSRTGMAAATSCRGSAPTPIASVTLTTAELEEVYRWLDRFEGFETSVAGPDGGTIALVFRGTGLELATPADQEAMLQWIDTLARRLRETALHAGAG